MDIFNCLLEIHKAQVNVGWFRPSNVVMDGNRPFIIRFNNASTNHACPGIWECDELLDAQIMLRVTPSPASKNASAVHRHKSLVHAIPSHSLVRRPRSLSEPSSTL
jgi:hypothetical protein